MAAAIRAKIPMACIPNRHGLAWKEAAAAARNLLDFPTSKPRRLPRVYPVRAMLARSFARQSGPSTVPGRSIDAPYIPMILHNLPVDEVDRSRVQGVDADLGEIRRAHFRRNGATDAGEGADGLFRGHI